MGLPSTHSPLGASGASRWMKCSGSVTLSAGVDDQDDDTYSAPGSAAHSLGEICLITQADTWEFVNWLYNGTEIVPPGGADAGPIAVDKEMADAVQVYIDAARQFHPQLMDRERTLIDHKIWPEYQFHCPSLHKFFYGTSDLPVPDFGERVLHIWDYKHGAGIVVEAPWNAQTMYYACGVLEAREWWERFDYVVLHIAQPRGFHYAGPVRQWSISIGKLRAWLDGVLLPAMDRALVSRDTMSGEHCRFCPARRRACPQLLKDADEFDGLLKRINMAKTEKDGARQLTNEEVARFLDLQVAIKIAGKAANETAFARLSNGQEIPGYKLGNARANRVWKEEAEEALKKKYGNKAYDTKLKSPAQIESMPEGETFAARYAYKPDAGLTVIPATDARPAVNQSVKSMFKPQRKGKK